MIAHARKSQLAPTVARDAGLPARVVHGGNGRHGVGAREVGRHIGEGKAFGSEPHVGAASVVEQARASADAEARVRGAGVTVNSRLPPRASSRHRGCRGEAPRPHREPPRTAGSRTCAAGDRAWRPAGEPSLPPRSTASDGGLRALELGGLTADGGNEVLARWPAGSRSWRT